MALRSAPAGGERNGGWEGRGAELPGLGRPGPVTAGWSGGSPEVGEPRGIPSSPQQEPVPGQ